MANSALTGIRVIEICRSWSATAMVGAMLGGLGAEVQSLEKLGKLSLAPRSKNTLYERSYAVELLNARKQPLKLDSLSGPNLRSAFVKLCADVDVLLLDEEAYQTCAEWHLDTEGLASEIPHLVACCISPFGLTGPLRDVPGSELIVQALTGVLTTNGFEHDPPIRAGVPIATCSGAVLAVQAILAALFERRRSHLGQLIDVAQYDALVASLGAIVPIYFLTGGEPKRFGNRHSMTSPWNAYSTSDGWIVIATTTDTQWRALAELIGQHEIVDDIRFSDISRRVQNTDILDAIIGEWTKDWSTDSLAQALDSIGVPSGPVLTVEEAQRAANHEFAAQHRLSFLHARDSFTYSEQPYIRTGSGSHSGSIDPVQSGFPREPSEVEDNLDIADEIANTPLCHSAPLTNVRVLEIATLTAGPFLGRILAMLGARVVKVEPPRGETARNVGQQFGGEGYLYHLNNTDKYSCVLDLEHTQEMEALFGLIRESDVLLTNLQDVTLKRMGLDEQSIQRANPRLIYCSITGYGANSTYAGRKAVDIVIQATSGIMSLTGLPSAPPMKVAMSIADLFGAGYAAIQVLAALFERSNVSGWKRIDVAMNDVALWTTLEMWPRPGRKKAASSRLGNHHPYFAPHNCYKSVDDMVAIVITDDGQWRSLLTVMGCDDLIADTRFRSMSARVKRVHGVDDLMGDWVAKHHATDVVDMCRQQGISAAIPMSVSQVVTHPHTKAREMIITLEHPIYGSIQLLGSPFKFSRTPAQVRRVSPMLGQHTDEILRQT